MLFVIKICKKYRLLKVERLLLLFSDWILNKGGVVYGVGYIGHFRVVHKKATTKVERNEFKGSKYVQSDLNSVFLKLKKI